MVYASKAGYIGGLVLLLSAFMNCFIERIEVHKRLIEYERSEVLLASIVICFLCMLVFEWWAIRRYKKKMNLASSMKVNNSKIAYLIKSACYRVFAIGLLLSLSYFIVHNHYYFQDRTFHITRIYFQYLLYLYWFAGIPYCVYTLKYKGGSRYEFNDYAILLMISYRSLFRLIMSKLPHALFHKSNSDVIRARRFINNRRIRKVYLVFLVNFFFLTLMTKFFGLEYTQFNIALDRIMSTAYPFFNELQVFNAWYQIAYHLIFYIDVGIAIIGYTIASRWLDNRTISVDMTFYGWFVVLLCYPPMNSGFTDHFIGYGRIPTHEIITSEILKMFLMSLILVSFSIYVWATMALGFKFSNLTNRGIISHGPYRFFRHPAYTAKNLAWWLDHHYVLSNIWAAAALLIWNVIYMLRGITEEKHLIKDRQYQHYVKQVTTRFIPKWPKKSPV